QAWLFSNWSRLAVRPWSAPAAGYLETRALPSSTTSGGLQPAKAEPSLVVMLFHCCSSTLAVSLGWDFFHSALTAWTTLGGALPSISQMVRVRGPESVLAWSLSPEESPQAATPMTRANARARAAGRRWRKGLDMDLPPCCWDGRRSVGWGAAGGRRPAGQAVGAVDDGA